MINVLTTALETHVQTILIQALKQYFATISDFRYNEDKSKTDIYITGEHGKISVLYPTIVVRSLSGSVLQRSIGDQTFREVRGDRLLDGVLVPNCLCGYTYGGAHNLNITISVVGRSGPVIRQVRDYLVMFFSVVYRKYLGSKGITLVDMGMSDTVFSPIGNNIFRSEDLNLKLFTEWRETSYNVPLISGINYIGVTVSI